VNFIHPEHEVCQLARRIDWEQPVKDLTPFYSEVGRPTVQVRTIVGLLQLKKICTMADETVIER